MLRVTEGETIGNENRGETEIRDQVLTGAIARIAASIITRKTMKPDLLTNTIDITVIETVGAVV